MLANKQGPDILQALVAPGDLAWIVPVPGHASWRCDQLAEQLQANPSLAAALHPARDLSQALNLSRAVDGAAIPLPGQRDARRVVVAGSLYLIGHAMASTPLAMPD